MDPNWSNEDIFRTYINGHIYDKNINSSFCIFRHHERVINYLQKQLGTYRNLIHYDFLRGKTRIWILKFKTSSSSGISILKKLSLLHYKHTTQKPKNKHPPYYLSISESPLNFKNRFSKVTLKNQNKHHLIVSMFEETTWSCSLS